MKCMFISGWKWETGKIMIPSPFLLAYESLASVKQNTGRKIKKKKRKKVKNMDRTQTKLNAPHDCYNIKILPK